MTLLSQFSAVDSALQANLPSTLSDMKSAAQAKLSGFSMPDRKTEHWKYSFKRLQGSDALQAAVTDAGAASRQIDIPGALHIELVNGCMKSGIGEAQNTEGLQIKQFSELNEHEASLIAQHASENEQGEFEHLNNAVFESALYIAVEKGKTIEQPIVLHQHHEGNGIGATRVFVLLNPSSSATLIESFASRAEDALTLTQTDFIVSANARLTYLRMNLATTANKLMGTTRAILQRDANLETHDLCLGSALGRHDLHVVMSESGAHCDLNGVVVTRNNEHFDNHTVIDHVAPHCTSEENYRCIADDSSHIVFNGRIHIHRDAQKTEGAMNNKNLLLSSKASIDTKPELEIYADDVKCAHGATIGQLNEKEVYYLKTRGLTDQQARQMLTLGFVLELVRAVPVSEVAELWESRLSDMLSFQHDGE